SRRPRREFQGTGTRRAALHARLRSHRADGARRRRRGEPGSQGEGIAGDVPARSRRTPSLEGDRRSRVGRPGRSRVFRPSAFEAVTMSISARMTKVFADQFESAWARTDALLGLVAPGAILDRPIALRHPFIFYVGHLPAFAWNHICRGVLAQESFHP